MNTARCILAGRLYFGDDQQIRALELVDLFERVCQLGLVVQKGTAIINCRECAGIESRCGEQCFECGGLGEERVQLEMMDKDFLLRAIQGLAETRK